MTIVVVAGLLLGFEPVLDEEPSHPVLSFTLVLLYYLIFHLTL